MPPTASASASGDSVQGKVAQVLHAARFLPQLARSTRRLKDFYQYKDDAAHLGAALGRCNFDGPANAALVLDTELLSQLCSCAIAALGYLGPSTPAAAAAVEPEEPALATVAYLAGYIMLLFTVSGEEACCEQLNGAVQGGGEEFGRHAMSAVCSSFCAVHDTSGQN
jgi:hypothetical protein